MKRQFIKVGMAIVLALATTDAMAQRGRSNGNGQGRQSGGNEIQVRAGNQNRVMQSQRAMHGPGGQLGNQSRQPSGVITGDTEGVDLLRMREEEKLARDVYTALAKLSNVGIFRNISRAESQHMQSVERLIRSGGANLNDTPGVFTVPEYQQLYESLVASGMRSPLDALKVGAKIEEMDIVDLRNLLSQTNDPQVRQVLERLMQASENHLRAFASQINRQGASYNAEFLTQAEFDRIASGTGQGRGQSAGNGNRFGQGPQMGGQGFGPQFQGNGGYGFGTQNQSGQGGFGQSAGGQGFGGNGRGQGRQGRR